MKIKLNEEQSKKMLEIALPSLIRLSKGELNKKKSELPRPSH